MKQIKLGESVILYIDLENNKFVYQIDNEFTTQKHQFVLRYSYLKREDLEKKVRILDRTHWLISSFEEGSEERAIISTKMTEELARLNVPNSYVKLQEEIEALTRQIMRLESKQKGEKFAWSTRFPQ